MSAGTSEFFCVICLLVCSCTAQTNIRHEKITAEVGQNVILPCKVPNNNIRAGEWIRPDQELECVLLYRNKRLHPENQYPSYQNRVDLQDKDMKDGNFSLILKNVMQNDTGIYFCRVLQKERNESISIINLVIHPPGDMVGIIVGSVVDDFCKKSIIIGLAVGLAAAIILLIVAVVLFVHTRRQNSKKKILVKENPEELKQLKETNDQLQQEKLENETLKNQLDQLERNISKTTDELQNKEENNKKAKSEIEKLQNCLQEYKDENLKRMETERKLKNQIQKLVEINFDSNSDSTGNNKKNQQKELEKQKWMETVGKLKTELQKINQELKLTGPITVEQISKYGYYISLKNISSEEIKLGGWKLELQKNNREPAEYRFNESVKLQAGGILAMGHISRYNHPEDVKLEWPDMKWNPEDKLRLKLISNNGEIFKLL